MTKCTKYTANGNGFPPTCKIILMEQKFRRFHQISTSLQYLKLDLFGKCMMYNGKWKLGLIFIIVCEVCCVKFYLHIDVRNKIPWRKHTQRWFRHGWYVCNYFCEKHIIIIMLLFLYYTLVNYGSTFLIDATTVMKTALSHLCRCREH